MKHAFKGLLFCMISVSCCYADDASDACSNPNPYLQQTCQSLKQSAAQTQKARDEESEKITAKHEEAVRKAIEKENVPPTPPPAAPSLPTWQQALKPPAPVEKKVKTTDSKPSEDTDTASVEASPITPLAPIGPTEFAGPKAATLPGGVNVVPMKPDKGTSQSTIKYY